MERDLHVDGPAESLSSNSGLKRDLDSCRESVCSDSGEKRSTDSRRESVSSQKTNSRRGSFLSAYEPLDSRSIEPYDPRNFEIRCRSGSQKKRTSVTEADPFKVQLKHRDAGSKAGLVTF